jgi:hypothetical protein
MKTKVDLAYEKMNKKETLAAEILKYVTESKGKESDNFSILKENGYNIESEFDYVSLIYDNRENRDVYYVVLGASIIQKEPNITTAGHYTIWTKMVNWTRNQDKAIESYKHWVNQGNPMSDQELAKFQKMVNDIVNVKKKTRSLQRRIEILKSYGYDVNENMWFDTKRCDFDGWVYRLGNSEVKEERHELPNGKFFIETKYKSPCISI